MMLSVIATFLFAVSVLPSPAVEIKSVQPRYIEEKEFQRIREYLTGEEFQGRRLILRTQPDKRSGLYFVLTLNRRATALPKDSQIRVDLVTTEDRKRKSFTLKIPHKRTGTREIFFGLTGSDWPARTIPTLAWRVSLIDSAKKIIHAKESFLWHWH